MKISKKIFNFIINVSLISAISLCFYSVNAGLFGCCQDPDNTPAEVKAALKRYEKVKNKLDDTLGSIQSLEAQGKQYENLSRTFKRELDCTLADYSMHDNINMTCIQSLKYSKYKNKFLKNSAKKNQANSNYTSCQSLVKALKCLLDKEYNNYAKLCEEHQLDNQAHNSYIDVCTIYEQERMVEQPHMIEQERKRMIDARNVSDEYTSSSFSSP